MKEFRNTTALVIIFLIGVFQLFAQNEPKESDYYRMTTLPIPIGIDIEAGGVVGLQDGSIAVATRKGDVWIVENPSMAYGSKPHFRLFASGLHEPLGLVEKDLALYTAQRGELTKLIDEDGDRIADIYETIYAWPLSTNYHEYSFGPILGPDDAFYVTMNVGFGLEGEWFRGDSRVPWRGWAVKITEDGTMTPWATGMRSPAGPGSINGEFFYTDNQGDWVGSGALWHVPKGAFIANPAGLNWAQEENSPITFTKQDFYDIVDARRIKKNGKYLKPENIENEEDPDFLHEIKEKLPSLQIPSVILPHGILGISNSEPIVDDTAGKFGPFANQIFIGDQGQSKIMRVVLEKVNGAYQGVAFDFRSGFQSGVMRMNFDTKGNMFVGETNRGWGSAGTTDSGMEFLTWTGKMPFEMKTVKAKPDGFEIEFTKPIDKTSAEYLDAYTGKSYIYKYHPVYGSPQTNIEPLKLKGVKASDDGLKVRLVIDNLRPFYVHELMLAGIKDAETGEGLLHQSFYYTLNVIPEGEKLLSSEISTKRHTAQKKSSALSNHKTKLSTPDDPKQSTSKAKNISILSEEKINILLKNNTCVACHLKEKRLIGPSFKDIAKRGYSNNRIVELIYKPEPKNWPEYATPMAPMPQVPKKEALQIAQWINALD